MMSNHNLTISVTNADVVLAKKMIGLSAADESTVYDLQPFITPHCKEIVERFYSELLEFEYLQNIISKNTSVTRLKQTFLEYFREMFAGSYGIDYYQRRLQIGLTHARVGLELNWYLSFISRMNDEVFKCLADHFSTMTSIQCLEASRSVSRIFAFDQSLATQAYHLFVTQTLEKQLKDANSGRLAKINFLASMSHELRTPLNSILGFSDLMTEQKLVSSETGVKYLNTIVRNSRSLLTLIDDILELAKANSGKMRLHIETFSIDALMEDVEISLRNLIVNKGITIRVEWPRGLTLRTDYGKLKRILFNLISNSVKFTANGQISVEATESGELVEFRVRDTGIGIAPDELDMIFQEFVQGNQQRGQRSQGAGLGLAICRNLCSLLGGSISATSELNEGSVFTVRIAKLLDMAQSLS